MLKINDDLHVEDEKVYEEEEEEEEETPGARGWLTPR